jgi:ligand-binding sensor domain-containing protein
MDLPAAASTVRLPWRGVLLTLLACLACTQSGVASARFRVEHWTQLDGLPSNALQATVTDDQGFLWVATDQGLTRFDGRDWRVFDTRNTPVLGSNEVRSLFLRRDGSLVVSMARGRVLAYRSHEFTVVTDLDAPASEIREDTDGSLLMAGPVVTRIGSDDAVTMLLNPKRTGEAYIPFVLQDSSLALALSGGISELFADRAAPWQGPSIAGTDGGTLVVHVENDEPWVLGSNARWRLDRERREFQRFDIPLGFLPVVATRGPDGWLWIGGRGDQNGLCRTPGLGAGAACEPVTELAARNVTNLQMDQSGALWITSWDAGLFRVTTPPIALFGAESGLRERARTLLATQDGAVLVGARQALYRINGEQVSALPWPTLEATGDRLLSLAQFPDGRVVRGRSFGIEVADPPAFMHWNPIRSREGFEEAPYSLYVDRSGALWTSNPRALRFDNGTWTELGGTHDLIYAFTEDRNGALWAAGYGAFRLDASQQFHDVGVPASPGRFILMSALTDSRGYLWFGGYECGLYRFDGHSWLHLDTARGLPDDTGYGLVEDKQQRLWVSHGRGLYTLSLDEADRLAHDSMATALVREYGSADGLPLGGFNGGSGLAAVKDRAGLLWFVGDQGAVRLDPDRLPEPMARPDIVIDSLRIDHDPLPPAAQLRLEPDVQSLSIEVRAPAPGRSERISLRYRLDPLERGWRALANTGQIEYQRLPPGHYQLLVQSAIDGVGWADGLQMSIEHVPHWWERPISWLLASILLAAAGAALTRWRLSALRARNRRLELLVAERSHELAGERIALAQAQGAHEEAERELLWLKRHRALEEWAEVDATARAVYAVLAHNDWGCDVGQLIAQLVAAKPGDGRRWTVAEVEAALDRLQARAAVAIDATQHYSASRPDWLLVPDLDLPLAELITRAAPRIGAYRLLEQIGEGAMGEVFRAVSVHDGTEAALKLVHRDASANAETRRRLEREGEIVSSLSHPNIVRLLERGEHDGRLYLAMEFLIGYTLQDRLTTQPALPMAQGVRILGDLAAALAALHERGVIHRDLHPGNVMILADGSARLLDFGLARAAATSAVTRADTLIGSLPYLAPEVIAGKPASAASDLFALGVLAIECLVGRRLWSGAQTLELVVEIARFEGPSPEILAGLDANLRPLVEQLLDLIPDRRGSSREALVALRAWEQANTPLEMRL